MSQEKWSEAEEVETEIIKWSDENKKPFVGKVVEGIVLSRKTQPNMRSNIPGAESVFYELATADGTKGFFGLSILDRKLKQCHGYIVRIECTGQVKTGAGNLATDFSVRRYENTPENRTKVGIEMVGEEVGKDEQGEEIIAGDIPFN